MSVQTIASQELLRSIVDMQAAFGGDAYARIEYGELAGRRGYLVTVRYTSYRATVGFLDQADVDALRWPLLWLRLRRRVARCSARIVSDQESPRYLDVDLNSV